MLQQSFQNAIVEAVRVALDEDVQTGDATTLALVPKEYRAKAFMVARQPLTVCGIQFATETYRQLDPCVQVFSRCKDGDQLQKGDVIMEINGPARAILTAERVSLNFMQHLSGIATMARRFTDLVAGTGVKILDTRKTLPGWRLFEKYAVTCGGAVNHRIGLYDMILIKDNHLVELRDAKPNPVAAAVQRARAAYPSLKVEVEADNLLQVRQAVDAGADIVLLDNMSNEMMREAVKLVQKRCLLEASGGVTLETVRGKAETGVDFISVGALTHSVRAVDIALDFQ